MISNPNTIISTTVRIFCWVSKINMENFDIKFSLILENHGIIKIK